MPVLRLLAAAIHRGGGEVLRLLASLVRGEMAVVHGGFARTGKLAHELAKFNTRKDVTLESDSFKSLKLIHDAATEAADAGRDGSRVAFWMNIFNADQREFENETRSALGTGAADHPGLPGPPRPPNL